MKDFFGTELAVGDIVAFNRLENVAGLIAGTVVRINPKMLRISYPDDRGHLQETNEYASDVVRQPRNV